MPGSALRNWVDHRALGFAQKWYLPERPTFITYKRQVIERHLNAEVLILGAVTALLGVMPRLFNDHAVNLAGARKIFIIAVPWPVDLCLRCRS